MIVERLNYTEETIIFPYYPKIVHNLPRPQRLDGAQNQFTVKWWWRNHLCCKITGICPLYDGLIRRSLAVCEASHHHAQLAWRYLDRGRFGWDAVGKRRGSQVVPSAPMSSIPRTSGSTRFSATRLSLDLCGVRALPLWITVLAPQLWVASSPSSSDNLRGCSFLFLRSVSTYGHKQIWFIRNTQVCFAQQQSRQQCVSSQSSAGDNSCLGPTSPLC